MREASAPRARCVALVIMLLAAWPAAAQNRTAKIGALFQDLYGPNGLVVNSEAVLPDGSTHSAHFNSAFQSNFTQFNIALASQLTALPLPSPASGFTYRFDPATGTFVRSTRSFGPILADRAETIGRNRFSFGYNFQFFSFDRLEGIALDRVPAVFTHDDHHLGGGRTDVVATVNSVGASVAQYTGLLTYGVTDRLDVSIAVPVIRTRLSVLSNATIHRLGTAGSPATHFFRDPDTSGTLGTQRQFFAEGTAAGLGDLILRAKATALREGHRGLAVGLDVRVPSGDEKDLIGSGALGLKPFAALSLSYARVSPHVNIGYQWNGASLLAGDIRTGRKADLPDQVLYAVGADIGVNERFSLAVDLLGQLVIDSPRLTSQLFSGNGPDASIVLPDIRFDTGSFSVMNGAAGFKTNLARDILINFNLRFKIGEAGLGDRVSPLIGLEYGF